MLYLVQFVLEVFVSIYVNQALRLHDRFLVCNNVNRRAARKDEHLSIAVVYHSQNSSYLKYVVHRIMSSIYSLKTPTSLKSVKRHFATLKLFKIDFVWWILELEGLFRKVDIRQIFVNRSS